MNCHIVEIDPFEDERWDIFVNDHPFGWLCHLSSWKKLIEESFPHIKGHYLAMVDEENDSIVAGLTFFEINSWITGKRLVSIPFATLSDPLVRNNDEITIFLKYFTGNLSSKKKICIELKTYKHADIIESCDLHVSANYINHYLSLENEPEVLLKRTFKTPIVRGIKKALKENIDIFEVSNSSHLNNFYKIYVDTRGRLGLPPMPFRFFVNLYNTLSSKNLISIQLAKLGNDIIGGLVLLKYKDRVSVDYLASDVHYRDIYIDTFLWWEAIKYSWQEGYKVFDFGRTSLNNSGLLTYKDRWGAERKNISHYSNNSSQNVDKENSFLYKPVKSLCMHAPSPILQLIGKLIYRHMG